MKFFRLLAAVCLVLALLASSALADPRYPARQGSVTDAAAVLSASTAGEVGEAVRTLEDKTDITLHVVTVDFLDGVTCAAYAEGLRSRWELEDEDVLLLLAVGEDTFGLYGGDAFTSRIPQSTQQKLLYTHLQSPFMNQDYDGALQAFIPALLTECGKVWDKTIDLKGLLGAPEATAAPLNAEDWLQRRLDQHRSEPDAPRRIIDEDEDTGVSLGKVILTIFLLTVIFGKKNRRHGRPGCGCGCMPFSSLLAALGLWKLWDKD